MKNTVVLVLGWGVEAPSGLDVRH